MAYKLKTIDTTKFLWTLILGIVFSGLGMIFLAIIIKTALPILLFFPLGVIIFIFAQRAFGKITEFQIENGILKTENSEIPLVEILGYYIDENVSMAAFNFKLKNGTIVKNTITTTGKWKTKYFDFINDFRNEIQKENPEVTFLEYAEAYPKSGKFIKFTVYLGIPLVIIIDLITLVTNLIGEPFFPWQTLLVNFYLLTLIPYVRKNKR